MSAAFSRRSFLQGVAVGGVAGFLVPYFWLRDDPGVAHLSNEPASDGLLDHLRNDRAFSPTIGKAYIDANFAGAEETAEEQILARVMPFSFAGAAELKPMIPILPVLLDRPRR